VNFNDACTLWIEHIGPFDWRQCCVQHDADYAHQVAKAIADARLETCVNGILPFMGTVMWLGVTVLGAFWYAAVARKRHQ
jgi:hypothetical protein